MLILSRRINESIIIGDNIEIKIVDINSKVIKIGIEAPKDVVVHRKEVYEAIKSENLMAPMSNHKNIISLFEYYNKVLKDK